MERKRTTSTSLSVYSPHDLYERVIQTVVGVRNAQGMASGVLITPNGLVATNRHVVGTDTEVSIRLTDGRELPGVVLASFLDVDTAFVKTALEQNPYGELLRGRKLQVGEAVYAIGHPYGLEYTLTQGIVSSVERVIDGATYLQTDASIHPGNSGGPLYSARGEIVGINTLGIRGSSGLNFAVPSDIIAAKYQELLARMGTGTQGRYCGVCGNISSNSRYCDRCGATILAPTASRAHQAPSAHTGYRSDIVACRVCRNPVQPSEKYCRYCGTEVEEKTQ